LFDVRIVELYLVNVLFLQKSTFQLRLRCRQTCGLGTAGISASVFNGPTWVFVIHC